MARRALADLHVRLVDLLSSGSVRADIELVLRQPDRLARIVSRSYVHPNGFRKIVLAAYEDGAKMRLHHWTLAEAEDSNVHNHRWDFASAVVAGRIHSALLEAADDGESLERYRFAPSAPGGRYTLAPAGAGRVATTSIAEFGPGSTYALDAGQLHRVRAEAGTVSIVLSAPPARSRTDVFRASALEPQSLDLPLLSVGEMEESLSFAAAALQAR